MFAYLEEKDQFIWFHHTWKHEKLTNIDDKISLIASTNLNLDFAQVNYFIHSITINDFHFEEI